MTTSPGEAETTAARREATATAVAAAAAAAAAVALVLPHLDVLLLVPVADDFGVVLAGRPFNISVRVCD